MDVGHVLFEFGYVLPIMLSSSSSLCSGVLLLVVGNVRACLGRGFRSMVASLLCNAALFDDDETVSAGGAGGAGNTRGAGGQEEEEEASWIWIWLIDLCVSSCTWSILLRTSIDSSSDWKLSSDVMNWESDTGADRSTIAEKPRESRCDRSDRATGAREESKREAFNRLEESINANRSSGRLARLVDFIVSWAFARRWRSAAFLLFSSSSVVDGIKCCWSQEGGGQDEQGF